MKKSRDEKLAEVKAAVLAERAAARQPAVAPVAEPERELACALPSPGPRLPVAPRTTEAMDVALLARRHTKRALRTLTRIMEDPSTPAMARIAAAKEVLNRGHGTASTAVDITRGMSKEDLATLAAALLDQRQAQLQDRAATAKILSVPEDLPDEEH